MDCHADKSARNDSKLDSTTSVTILNKSAKDSRILDEKCGLQGKSQGSYLDGNDRRDFSPLPHFSLKAQSTKKAKSPQANQAVGGRIFDEKAGLRRLLCGDKTSGLSHKQKASSLLYRKTSEAVQGEAEAGFFSKKPTPLRKVAYAAA